MTGTKFFLLSAEGREFLDEAYNHKHRSTYDIAQELGSYPNAINRALRYHGFTLRDKAEAQREALKSGRHEHPTEGKKRSPDERQRISESMAKAWKIMTPDEREARVNQGKQQWEAMSEDEREKMAQAGAEGVRRAAQEGSKLEHFLLMSLRSLGYKVEFHAEVSTGGELIHVDMLLPVLMVAVQVDGPSHFLPIWGEDQLARKIFLDNRRNGFLIQGGHTVIRVKHLKRSLSEYQKRTLLTQLKEALEKLGQDTPLVELEAK